MADEIAGTDNAQAPEPEQTETPGAETASATQTQQPDYAALMARMEAATKAAENAARFAHQRDTELAQLRREKQQWASQGYQRQDATDDQTTATTAPATDYTTARLSLMEFKLAHPDWKERLAEMQESAQDPAFSERFGADLNSRVTFEAAYEVAENRRLRKENETLRAVKERAATAREAGKVQASVSGQGASQPQEVISEAELQKMTREEMEKKFGKDALSRSIAEMWSPGAR